MSDILFFFFKKKKEHEIYGYMMHGTAL